MSRRLIEAAAFVGILGYAAGFGLVLILIGTKP